MSILKIAKRDLEKYKEKHKDYFYGIGCYESALKVIEAFDKEMRDSGHSGFSANFTKNIIKSWLFENPIFPIEDSDFEKWDYSQKGVETYYFEGIFKEVYPDGNIEYYDLNRVVYHDTYGGKDIKWQSGDADKIVDEYIGKITMRYKREKIHVYGEDKYLGKDGEDLTEDYPGETNYRYIKYILKEDRTKIIVNKEIRK